MVRSFSEEGNSGGGKSGENQQETIRAEREETGCFHVHPYPTHSRGLINRKFHLLRINPLCRANLVPEHKWWRGGGTRNLMRI